MNLSAVDKKLNQMVLDGKPLQAFEEFYAEDCVMQEQNQPPVEGKAANRKREKAFFDGVAELHSAKLNASGLGDGVTFAEWTFDMTMKSGQRMQLQEVSRRRWKDGKIVHERFYYTN